MTQQPPTDASPTPQGVLMDYNGFISRFVEEFELLPYDEMLVQYKMFCFFTQNMPWWKDALHDAWNALKAYRTQQQNPPQPTTYNDNRQINLTGNDATYNENPHSAV